MPGSYVYAMAADGGVGNLMRVVEDEGDEEVLVEYLSLDKTKAGRKASKGPVFVLERVGGESAWLADPRSFGRLIIWSLQSCRRLRVE